MVLGLQKLELVLNPVTGFSHCEFNAGLSRLMGALRKKHIDWWPGGAQPPPCQPNWSGTSDPGKRLGEPSGLPHPKEQRIS